MTLSLISRLLGNVVSKRCFSTTQKVLAAPQLDPLQVAALDQEYCILVDEADKTTGSATKRECHQVDKNGNIPLHRAFSVCLFNSKGDMLLQKRGHKKVTFPSVYTNACCSHPLWMGDSEEGILAAAQRRLHHELGIPPEQMSDKDFTYLTRIHYHHVGDGKWGEHEIDYILILQKDVHLEPNRDEVDELIYIPRKQLEERLSSLTAPISPWFQLILDHRLRFWWDNLHQLQHCQDHSHIYKY